MRPAVFLDRDGTMIEEETFAGFEAYTAGTLLFLLLTLLTVGSIYLLQRWLGLKVRTAA